MITPSLVSITVIAANYRIKGHIWVRSKGIPHSSPTLSGAPFIWENENNVWRKRDAKRSVMFGCRWGRKGKNETAYNLLIYIAQKKENMTYDQVKKSFYRINAKTLKKLCTPCDSVAYRTIFLFSSNNQLRSSWCEVLFNKGCCCCC